MAWVVVAALLVAVLPGFVATAAMLPSWRWWEQAAAAPGIGVGLVGLLGLAYHDAHLRFSVASVLPVLGAITVAAGIAWYLRREKSTASRGWADAAIPAAALAAGAASIAVALAGFHGQPLPIYSDSALHATITHAIAANGDAVPAIPQPVDHSSFTRPRTAVEASAALVSSLTGAAADDALMVLGLIAMLALPLGLAALALETTASWRIAAVAPLVALGMAMPKWPFLFGEYPLLLDATLVAPLVIAALRSVRGRRQLSFIAAAVAAIFVTHGLEALTALVVGAGAVLGATLAVRRPAIPRLAFAAAAAAAGAIVVTLLVHVATPPAAATVADTTASSEAVRVLGGPVVVGARWVVDNYVSSELGGALVAALLVAGMALAIVRRRLRWAVFVAVFFFLVLLDVQALHRFSSLWQRIYPWAVEDRLRDMEYWAVPLLVALAVDELITAGATVVRRARLRNQVAWSRRATIVVAGVAVLLIGLVAANGISRDRQTYAGIVPAYSKATAADVALMDRMAGAIPAGSLILTDGEDDAGIWVNALTPDLRFEPKSWVQSHPDDPRVVALQEACSAPDQAAAALAGVDAVFVGSRHSADAAHPWNLDCIRRVAGLRPRLQVSVGSATAALFTVQQRGLTSGGTAP